jgi:hypothetical protein
MSHDAERSHDLKNGDCTEVYRGIMFYLLKLSLFFRAISIRFGLHEYFTGLMFTPKKAVSETDGRGDFRVGNVEK